VVKRFLLGFSFSLILSPPLFLIRLCTIWKKSDCEMNFVRLLCYSDSGRNNKESSIYFQLQLPKEGFFELPRAVLSVSLSLFLSPLLLPSHPLLLVLLLRQA